MVSIDKYSYSIQSTLFDDETNAIVFEDTINKKKLSKPHNPLIHRSIISHSQSKRSFILYISDLTSYSSLQPLLQLDVIVTPLSGGNYTYTIPLSFSSKSTNNFRNRRIEIPLPPMNEFKINSNISRMKQ